MISIEDISTMYSAPTASSGISMPVSCCTCFICALTAGSFTPIGLPISTARLDASTSPSGAWPETAMPSRSLRTM